MVTEDFKQWMADRHFRFQKLVVTGIDNEPVLRVNHPDMAGEETCLFHDKVPDGDAYVNRLQERVEAALAEHRPLPVVRFADGEYAFYAGNLDCNGLYRQAESVKHIQEAWPTHAQALQALSRSGLLAPLIFPGNVAARPSRGLFSFFKRRHPQSSASTFLSFLDRYAIPLNDDHYIPFYIVYAYLTSQRFARSLDSRKVCILTADGNREAVRTWFASFDSRPDLVFVELPAEYVATQWATQRETVLPKIPADTHFCLVGAGIGALTVCVDVAGQLSIPAIDAGHALNMMNDRVDKSNGARLYTLWKAASS